MDKCTHEVRMEYWKNIITQCQNRPEGQSARQWMEANGICEGTYYLWQKRIRQQTYEQMVENKQLLPATKKIEEITFAELPIPQTRNVPKADLSESVIPPAAVIKTQNFSVALSADIPDALLVKILQEVAHA